MVDVECCFLSSAAWIRMVFVSEWCVNFTRSRPADAPQYVDRTPLRNGSEPGCKWAVRIVGLPRAVNGEQCFLHNVVYQIGSYSLATRHPFDRRYAVAQQRFVGGSIAGLRGDHPGRPPTI